MKLLVNATSIASNNFTGIERFALRLSQELYLIHKDVEIVSTIKIPGGPIAQVPALLIAGKTLLHRREYLFRAFWDQTCFRYHVARSKPDVVFFPIQDGLLFPPVKQIITVHDLHYLHFERSIQDCKHEIGRFRTGLYRYKMPHILERSAAVIAVSESTKQDIVSSFGIDPNKIQVIFNGYDEGRFRVIADPQPVLERYGLQSGTYFLFVGSILKHKNLVRLVQALARVGGQATLVVAGVCKDADYREEVMRVTGELGIPETGFRYLDYVPDDDLPHLYRGALAYLLPSLHEGFGVPIIEAMACGTPVITSNCSSMPEIAGNAALLVDPYSVESIAAAMREILHNPHRAEALRKAGLERAKMFRWSYSAQKLYDLCRSVSES